jgi:hypothetical protein
MALRSKIARGLWRQSNASLVLFATLNLYNLWRGWSDPSSTTRTLLIVGHVVVVSLCTSQLLMRLVRLWRADGNNESVDAAGDIVDRQR